MYVKTGGSRQNYNVQKCNKFDRAIEQNKDIV